MAVGKWRCGCGRPEPAGFGEKSVRAFVIIAAALALGLMATGCDRCGDPVKINLPGVNACSDSR